MNGHQSLPETLDLCQALQCELINDEVNIQTANQVGELINKDCLEDVKQNGLVEYQRLTNWLNQVKFLSQSNNYQPNSMLLDTDSQDEEEKLLSAFAPDEYVLNQQYGNTGKDFFHACRPIRLGREKEERLVEWILAITVENKRLAAIRYLEYLRIVDDSLFSSLLSRLEKEKVDWLQEFFSPKQDIDGTTETTENDGDGNLIDTRDIGNNPKWGEPGEALAKLFYDYIYQDHPNYRLDRKGGRDCNHDFLLCIDGRKIEIEVKTIASKSFRLSPSEWNELTSRNDNYELFVVEHSGSDVTRVIRIQNAWNTLQKALAKLDLQDLTSETENIETLIGLQKDKSKNVVILNWDRLIDIYGKRSNDENITFYSCNAKLVCEQRSVNPLNPEFTEIIRVKNAS